LIAGVNQVAKDIAMVQDERLGFLTCSPANLGNSIHVSIRMELEKLPHKNEKLNEIVTKHHMKIRKLSAEENGENEKLYEVESNHCMGVTEFEAVKEIAEGVIALIDGEKSL
jgi:arginine kinase